MIRSEALVV